jgi:endonuclease YncB( thermonuclease family)
MRRQAVRKGAPLRVAPFSFLALCACLAGATPALPGSGCPATRIDERVRVDYVYDGDTVRLADGRRVRLIGINTPEMAREDETGEPLAATARAHLQDMLDRGNGVLQLEYGTEHHDRYGRLLAHGYLENGDNVAARLLQQGLATALVVPPNTRAMDCYRRLEDDARRGRRGLWALPQYQASAAASLPETTRGFRLVQGRVTAVRDGSRSTWLDIDDALQLHVSHRDQDNFPPGYLQGLAGRDIEARGWIKHGRDGLRMNVRHPAALQAITPRH